MKARGIRLTRLSERLELAISRERVTAELVWSEVFEVLLIDVLREAVVGDADPRVPTSKLEHHVVVVGHRHDEDSSGVDLVDHQGGLPDYFPSFASAGLRGVSREDAHGHEADAGEVVVAADELCDVHERRRFPVRLVHADVLHVDEREALVPCRSFL